MSSVLRHAIVIVFVGTLTRHALAAEVPPQSGPSPQDLAKGVADQVKEFVDGGGLVKGTNEKGNEVGYSPIGHMWDQATIDAAKKAKEQEDKLKKELDAASKAAEEFKNDSTSKIDGKPANEHFAGKKKEAQEKLDAFRKENGHLLKLLEEQKLAEERMRKWKELLQQLQSLTGAGTWTDGWTPSGPGAAADKEDKAAKLVKQLAEEAKKAREDAKKFKKMADDAAAEAKKAAAAGDQTTADQKSELADTFRSIADLANQTADKFDSWAKTLAEAQQKQAEQAVRDAQERHKEKRDALIKEAKERGIPNPERYADRRLEGETKKLNEAQEALAAAGKSAAAGKLEEAIRRYSGILRAAEALQFAALTKPPGDTRLASVTPAGPPVATTTLVSQADLKFVTPSGTQAYAVVEHFAAQADLGGLRQFGRQLTATLAADPSDPAASPEKTELTQIAGVIDSVEAEVRRQRGLVAGKRAEIAQAGTDLAKIADILSAPLSSQPAQIPQAAIDPAAVFRDFLPTMTPTTAEPGAAVAKGGAVVDGASGTPLAQVTLKLSFSGPEDPNLETPGSGAPHSEIVRTNPEGRFQFTVPPGSQLVDVQLGADNVVTPSSGAMSDPALLSLVATPPGTALRSMSPEQLRQLAPDQQATLLSLPLTVSEVWSQSLSGQPAYLDTLTSATPAQVAQQAVPALATMGLLLGGLPDGQVTPQRLLDLATAIPANLADKPPLQDIPAVVSGLPEATRQNFQAASSSALQTLSDPKAPTISTSPKPLQIAVDLRGAVTEEQVRQLENRLQEAVQAATPGAARIELSGMERQDLSLPDTLGGPSTVITFSLVPRQADSSPATVDLGRLQPNLDNLARSLPGVNFVEAARPCVAEADGPADPHVTARGTWNQEYADQWAVQRAGFSVPGDAADSAWSSAMPRDLPDGLPCIVAVIGSGVDWTHPELLGQMWANKGEDPYNGRDDDENGYVDDLFGWNFRDHNRDVLDHGGHDTHIAGVIAARWNEQGIAGINPHARIMALRVADYRGQANSIDISRAIFYAVDKGARVINISYGGTTPTRIEQRAIDYANGRDVLVVVAAGNQAADAADRGPAGNRGVLTVAGTTVEDKRAAFSNWGQPVDLAAPAMDVLGLRARGTDFLLYVGENPDYVAGTGVVGRNKDLYRASGTSFAAPLVSGTASLIFSLRPGLTAEQVQRMLIMGADDIELPGWDQYTGTGRLNAVKSLQADPNYELQARISGVVPLRQGNQISLQVRGQATGTTFEGRWLQIGLGESPTEWTTVAFERTAVPEDGLLSTIPMTRFARRGVWTIRLLVRDTQQSVRQGRAQVNLE